LETSTKEKHWSDSLVIDWSDTCHRKNVHKVVVIEEGWFGDSYYIKCPSVSSKTKQNNVASTDGRLGNCLCESFIKTAPTPTGKVPCLHLWECRDRMFKRIDKDRAYDRDYDKKRRKRLDKAICNNLKELKDDPNSLMKDDKFVKKMIKGEKITQ
jgi:hypothetical protein